MMLFQWIGTAMIAGFVNLVARTFAQKQSRYK